MLTRFPEQSSPTGYAANNIKKKHSLLIDHDHGAPRRDSTRKSEYEENLYMMKGIKIGLIYKDKYREQNT